MTVDQKRKTPEDVKTPQETSGADMKKPKLSKTPISIPPEIKIASAEGTIFYIETFYLQAASSVLRDILSGPSSFGNSEDSPALQIFASEPVLNRFLELLKGLPRTREYSEPEYSELIRLCNKLDATTIRIVLNREIRDRLLKSKLDPWDGFILASKLSDKELAREAIELMDDRHSWIWCTWTKERLGQATAEYTAILINAVIDLPKPKYTPRTKNAPAKCVYDWDELAEKI